MSTGPSVLSMLLFWMVVWFSVYPEGWFCWMRIASECYNVVCYWDSLTLKLSNVVAKGCIWNRKDKRLQVRTISWTRSFWYMFEINMVFVCLTYIKMLSGSVYVLLCWLHSLLVSLQLCVHLSSTLDYFSGCFFGLHVSPRAGWLSKKCSFCAISGCWGFSQWFQWKLYAALLWSIHGKKSVPASLSPLSECNPGYSFAW